MNPKSSFFLQIKIKEKAKKKNEFDEGGGIFPGIIE